MVENAIHHLLPCNLPAAEVFACDDIYRERVAVRVWVLAATHGIKEASVPSVSSGVEVVRLAWTDDDRLATLSGRLT